MPAPDNVLKRRLAAGESLNGCWLGLADGYAAEIAATAGFDWLLIDGEHAPNDLRSMLPQLVAVDASESAAIVRLPDADPARIKQALDIGAQSLLIPMIDNADQARAALAATRYPPAGIRGVGAALARASRYSGIPDYLGSANEQICLLVQVESRAGIEALDDILAVEGLDGVFIGPSDLAADMGHLGDPDHPDVVRTILDALRRIRAAGKAAGVLALDPAFATACREAGANFVGIGIDVTLLAGALRRLARRGETPFEPDESGAP